MVGTPFLCSPTTTRPSTLFSDFAVAYKSSRRLSARRPGSLETRDGGEPCRVPLPFHTFLPLSDRETGGRVLRYHQQRHNLQPPITPTTPVEVIFLLFLVSIATPPPCTHFQPGIHQDRTWNCQIQCRRIDCSADKKVQPSLVAPYP
jgi:hypothetical protein